ncbi:TPA: hypothetical protein DEX28_03000 [Patescibacteria group bacterium]|nr:MAG: hypothetical protein UW89_C0002G0030 [Parcubacteria group bacterium GW2011_GWB1_45_10]HCI05690.1 hypothetical protein [Patescibacteria group bacterium]
MIRARKKSLSGLGQIAFITAGTLLAFGFFVFAVSGGYFRSFLETRVSLNPEAPLSEKIGAFSPKPSQKTKIVFDSKKPAASSNVPETQVPPLTADFFGASFAENKPGAEEAEKPFSKILISEVLFGTKNSAREEFVELFNPNDFDVDLSSWELRKKTESGQDSVLVSAEKFSGKILSQGYFLISHPDFSEKFGAGTGWSSKSYSISENNAIYLFDSSGRLADLLGCGSAFDYEGSSCSTPESGKSVSRKAQNQDTNNNLGDFVVSEVSPKNPVVLALLPSSTPLLSLSPSPSLLQSPAASQVSLTSAQIKEVQFGLTGSLNSDFVKMFNPNSVNLDLKDYKLVKKTASSGNETSLKSWRNDGSDGIIPAQAYFYWVNSNYQEKISELQTQGIRFFMTTGTITETNGVALKYQDAMVSSINW